MSGMWLQTRENPGYQVQILPTPISELPITVTVVPSHPISMTTYYCYNPLWQEFIKVSRKLENVLFWAYIPWPVRFIWHTSFLKSIFWSFFLFWLRHRQEAQEVTHSVCPSVTFLNSSLCRCGKYFVLFFFYELWIKSKDRIKN